jgi:hypothetical protein
MTDACSSFADALGGSLYRNAVERERALLFGAGATVELFTVDPFMGEQTTLTLASCWSARRIPTIESGAEEAWRLEIVGDVIAWAELREVATVRIRAARTGEAQHYKVVQVENAMKPGRVYALRLIAIGQL